MTEPTEPRADDPPANADAPDLEKRPAGGVDPAAKPAAADAVRGPIAPPGGPPGAPPPKGPADPPGDDGADGSGEDDEELTPEELARRRKWAYRKRRAREFATMAGKGLIVVVLFTIVIFFDRIVHSVYPGEIGVLWSRFFGGTQLDDVYREGMVITFPWDEFYKYDVRVQELKRTTVVYAQDGLEITVNTSVRYRPKADQVPRLHQDVGPEYVQKIVEPETISTLRRVLGNYTPEMIYAKDEQGLLLDLSKTLRAELDPEYFVIVEFLVLELRLPSTIENAIKDKLTQEQQMLSYRFRLETEKDEKERRIIEAEGLKAFETISGVPILKWRGIEATETLARSPSSKIVLMGTGGDQLPIILNADVAPPGNAAPPPVPASEEPAAESPHNLPSPSAGNVEPAPAEDVPIDPAPTVEAPAPAPTPDAPPTPEPEMPR